MYSISSFQQILPYLIILCLTATVLLRYNLHRLPLDLIFKESDNECFTWKSTPNRTTGPYECPRYAQMSSLVWTYEGAGFLKYLQWIVTRKLANVRITRLNDHCQITYQHSYSTIDTIPTFIQVYIIPLSVTFINQSRCAIKIDQIASNNVGRVSQLHFKRKSIQSTFFFQQLDALPFYTNFSSVIGTLRFRKVERTDYLQSARWTTIYADDLIKSNLIDGEKLLKNLLRLLGMNTASPMMESIIEYDLHRFTEDATWWDQSDVAQRVLTNSIPSAPPKFSYSNDFYHVHGNRSFIEYLYRSRRCVTDGVFAQLQTNTTTNRSSTDQPDRCPRKPFDCAFSDLYSFADREQIYTQYDSQHYFNENTVKCGFAVPSIYDQVRRRYARNHTCETIVFTSVINCYDPLPEISGEVLPSFCFVALVDRKTAEGLKNHYKSKLRIDWDIIDLGINATPFSVPVKSVEALKILGSRLFPLAKWILWLDGKAHLYTITEILTEARAPVLGAAHPDDNRTSASEIDQTIIRVTHKEVTPTVRWNHSIEDIKLQEAEYARDGFYGRSNALGLRLYDIAVFLYRNNHPCIDRYLCAWHNEINYYSYRGQLSVFYPGVRLTVTDYLQFMPKKNYLTFLHFAIC